MIGTRNERQREEKAKRVLGRRAARAELAYDIGGSAQLKRCPTLQTIPSWDFLRDETGDRTLLGNIPQNFCHWLLGKIVASTITFIIAHFSNVAGKTHLFVTKRLVLGPPG